MSTVNQNAVSLGADAIIADPVCEHESDVITPEQFHQFVEVAAYYDYLNRVECGDPGDAASDWAQAEREIEAKYSIVSEKPTQLGKGGF
jgi:hypothetical protein